MEKRSTAKESNEVSPAVGNSSPRMINPAYTLYEKTTKVTCTSTTESSINGDAAAIESGDRAVTVIKIPSLHDLSEVSQPARNEINSDGPSAAAFIDEEDEGSGPSLELSRNRQENGDDGLDKIMSFSFKARDRSSLPPLRMLAADAELNARRAGQHHSAPLSFVNSNVDSLQSNAVRIRHKALPPNDFLQDAPAGIDAPTAAKSSDWRTTKNSTPERINSLPPLANLRTPTFESGQVGSVHSDSGLPYHHRRANPSGTHCDEEEEEIKNLRHKIQLLTQQANISQEARGRVLVQILQEGMHHSLASEPDHIDNENSPVQHGGVFERSAENAEKTPAAEAANKQHFADSSPSVASRGAASRTRLLRTQSSDVTTSSASQQQPQTSMHAVGDRRSSSKSGCPPSAIANDPQVKDVLLHQNAQPSPTQAAATQAAREQNAGAGIRQLCRIFCCPPTPGAIASKLAFVPPEPSYDMVPKAHENNIINDADSTRRGATSVRAHAIGKSEAGAAENNKSETALINSKKLSNSSSALSTSTAASTTTTPKLTRRSETEVVKEEFSSSSIPVTAQGGNGDGVDAESHAYKRKKRMQTSETQRQPSLTQVNNAGENALVSPVQRPAQTIDSVRDSYYLCLGGNFLEWTWGVHELQNNVEMFYGRTARGNKIACMYVRTAVEAEFTLLFSHGNAVDIGQMVPFYWSLGDRFRVNICAYDYSGYGKSSGKPSERNLYADIDGAWQAIRERYNLTEDQVILYGQSIGTVPTVDLASRNQNFAGVILHGPLASGLRIAFPETRRSCFFDVFRSIDKVHKISVPTLVIHGTEDEVIPLSNALALYEKLPHAVEPLFVDGGGHNDIELYAAYYLRLQQFIREEVQPFRQTRKRQQQQQMTNKASNSATTSTVRTTAG